MNVDGTVKSHQKISDTQGNFAGVVGDNDQFGVSLDRLGDLNGDGTIELAVGAFEDDDGGSNRGAVHILSLAGTEGGGGDPPTPVIIDNVDDGYTLSGFVEIPDANFPTPEGRDGDIENSQKGVGNDVATWTFEGLTPGRAYRVSATWSTHENRATDALYSPIDGITGLTKTPCFRRCCPNTFCASDCRCGIADAD